MLEGNFNSPEKSLLPKALSEMTFKFFGKRSSPLK